ncbi:substrate-binding domain-containing protein [bacterium]|nr:substrate-binding domain-containing protein [bacterium]
MSIGRQKILCIAGFGLILVFLVVSLTLLPDTGTATGLVLAAAVLITGFTGLFVIAVIYRNLEHQVHPYAHMHDTLILHDLKQMQEIIDGISTGHISRQISLNSRPLPPTDNPLLQKPVEILNATLRSLSIIFSAINDITFDPCRRLCYIGADSFLEGRKCGEIMGELLNGRGRVLIGSGRHVGTRLRQLGFESVIKEAFPQISIVDVFETQESHIFCTENLKAALKEHNTVNGVYICEGATPVAAAEVLMDLNKTGQVKLIGHDLTEDTMRLIKNGAIQVTLTQNPLAQGHDALIHLYNHIVDKWQPYSPRLLTAMEVVTADNVDKAWRIQSGDFTEGGDELARIGHQFPHEHPIKLLMLGRRDNPFWATVQHGVDLAVERFEKINVTVDIVTPTVTEETPFYDIDLYGPYLTSAREKGYDGVVTIVPDKQMIPLINELVDAGIPVITYNIEPASLRALIHTIVTQARKLQDISQMMQKETELVSGATSEINKAMNAITQRLSKQSEYIDTTTRSMESLIDYIQQIDEEAKASAAAAAATVDAVQDGTSAMSTTLKTMDTMEKSVLSTWHTVERLSHYSVSIDEVMAFIGDIASQVKMLAINATLQVTHADQGQEGFKVIVNEIRQLADNTTQAAAGINKLVTDLKDGITYVKQIMAEGLETIKGSANLANDALSGFSSLNDMVSEEKKRMDKIARSIRNIVISTELADNNVNKVADISKENSRSIAQTYDATRDISDRFSEINEIARNLNQMAQSELDLLAKFDL